MTPAIQPGNLLAYLANPSEAQREISRLFRSEEPLVILDIGACEGEDTIRYARHFPRARLFAFEPLPANQALVRANFSHHAIDRAELVPLALSDRAGEAVFHVSSGQPPEKFAGKDWNYGNKSSSLLPPAKAAPMYGWLKFNETIAVHTDTLDHFCAERGLGRIDFIHMDVQGAEHLVLGGAAATLPRVTAIWLEVSRRENYQGQMLDTAIIRFMRARGFVRGYATYRGDGIEGDHLYLNLSHPRTWAYAATRRLRAAAGRLKRTLLS